MRTTTVVGVVAAPRVVEGIPATGSSKGHICPAPDRRVGLVPNDV
jgi:hypothetical protein